MPRVNANRVASMSSDRKKIAQDVLTVFGKDGFRVELHTPYRMVAMLDGVNLGWVVLGAGNDLELFRQRVRLYNQRVVAHHFERARHTVEDSGSVVGHAGGFSMHQFPRAHDLSAVGFADRLMAETNSEDWNGASPAPNCRDGDSRFRRSARARRNHDPFHPQRTNFLNANLIVAPHYGSLA